MKRDPKQARAAAHSILRQSIRLIFAAPPGGITGTIRFSAPFGSIGGPNVPLGNGCMLADFSSLQGRQYAESQMLPFVLRIKASVDAGQTIQAAIRELVADQVTLYERTAGKKRRVTKRELKSAAEAIRRRYYEWHERFRRQCDLYAIAIGAADELGLASTIIESVEAPLEIDGYRSPIDYRSPPKRGRPRTSA